MSQLKTLTLLYDAIEKDYSWRIIELSNFRNSVIKAKGKAQEGMIRAGVTLIYSHWEGCIKKVADLYYEFVTCQKLTVEELSNPFIGISLRDEIELLSKSKKLEQHSRLVQVFFNERYKQAFFSSTSPIRTSNLKFDIFEDVCIMIGINVEELIKRYKIKFDRSPKLTIDENLVAKRNSIAHGEFLSVSINDFKELYDVIINGFLYNFKEIVMDAAQSKKFLKSNQSNI